MKIRHYVSITPGEVLLDGVKLPLECSGADILAELYRERVGDYPKFFKMDLLSKLGFIASELLVSGEKDRFVPREDRAVLLFSRSGPLCDDRNYQKTIEEGSWFPSPALFVYTLANIVTGEIAIRNRYEGDSTAYGLENFDAAGMVEAVSDAFEDRVTNSALCGWADAVDGENFGAFMMLVEQDGEGMEFSAEMIEKEARGF